MKKTLIALSVLAASGASFAQATITGSYIFGFKNVSTNAGAVSNGLVTDTANLQFKAAEDLGDGVKATAQVGLGGAARGLSIGGEDAFLQLEGGFGKVKVGSLESGDAYDAAVPLTSLSYGFDGSVFSANVTADAVTYSLPAFGAFTVSFGVSDYSTTAGSAGTYGNDAAAASAASSSVGVTYAAGPLSLVGKFASYKNREIAVNSSTSKSIVRATYDLGGPVVGISYVTVQKEQTDADALGAIGVTVPVGSLTLGLAYATKTAYASTGVAGDQPTTKNSGYVLAADYSLSKRTTLGVAAYSYASSLASANNSSNTGYRVLLGHNF